MDEEGKTLLEFWVRHIWVSLTLHRDKFWSRRVGDEGERDFHWGHIRLRIYPHEEYK